MSQASPLDDPLMITIGHDQLVIRRRYEIGSIFNDFLIAIWFCLGSIFSLFPSLAMASDWLFIIGSVQFLIRPTIRLAAHFHLRHIPESQWEH